MAKNRKNLKTVFIRLIGGKYNDISTSTHIEKTDQGLFTKQ